jgi:hypothetical protein
MFVRHIQHNIYREIIAICNSIVKQHAPKQQNALGLSSYAVCIQNPLITVCKYTESNFLQGSAATFTASFCSS